MPSFFSSAAQAIRDTARDVQRRFREPSHGRRLLDAMREAFTRGQSSPTAESFRTTPGDRQSSFLQNVVAGVRNAVENAGDRIRQVFRERTEQPTPDAPTPTPQRQPSRERMAEALEQHIAESREVMRNLATDLVQGRINPEQFRAAMGQEIRHVHLGAAMLGSGGALNLSAHHANVVDRAISAQMGYLDNFVQDIQRRLASGQGVGQRDIGRAGQYSFAARVTATQSERQFVVNESDGEAYERRVRTANESCEDCISYSQLGWQPAGTLPPISDSRCGHNCMCFFEYSDNPF